MSAFRRTEGIRVRNMLALVVVGISVIAAVNAAEAPTKFRCSVARAGRRLGGDAVLDARPESTTSNVSRLGGAWSIELPDRQVSESASSRERRQDVRRLVGGTDFRARSGDRKVAVDVQPEIPFSGSRGVGIGDGMLFAGLRDSSVIAISQQTGEIAWRHQRDPDIPAQGISSAAAYGNGVVVSVVSGGDNFARGRAFGLDARTGARLWNFEVVPGPDEPGHETWPADSDIWKYGGGALWTTPSVDADLGLVYLETGNAVPQWGGEIRAGNNLFDNSVVALELKTGRLRWYYQLVHHDIWEHDVSTPLVLYDASVGGRTRKLMAAMRTDGEMFYLDRETGTPVLPVEERPVKQDAFLKTSPTQPFTAGADRVGPWMRRQEHDSAWVCRGLLFRSGCHRLAESLHAAHEHAADADGLQPANAISLRVGVCEPRMDSPRRKPVGVSSPNASAGTAAVRTDGRGRQPAAGRSPGRNGVAYAGCEGGGGATATAGRLVFHVEPDGEFQAYDAKNGNLAWRFQTGEAGIGGGAGPGGGSAVSYAADGNSTSR